MTNYMLYRLTKRSNSMMANMLRIHIGYTPPPEELDDSVVDEILEHVPRPVDTCKVLTYPITLIDIDTVIFIRSRFGFCRIINNKT